MNIGVCGTGTIASWISSILGQLNHPEIKLYACASDVYEQTLNFKNKFNWEIAYKTVDELMQDSNVDIVYIAVPNNFHYNLCMKAINYGKNVVCEKPFAINDKETKEIIKRAREKNVFISEALWPNFLPSHKLINEEIKKGTIGDITSGNIIMLDFVMFLERVKHLETGGGSLLDGGPYTLGCLINHFGTNIKSIEATARKLDTLVDAEDNIKVTYNNGVIVNIRQTIDMPHDKHEEYFEIIGTKGKIWADCISNPRKVLIYDNNGNVIKQLDLPPQIKNQGMPPVSGYEFEWLGFLDYYKKGSKETLEISNADTIKISEIMTEIRHQTGVIFPFEK